MTDTAIKFKAWQANDTCPAITQEDALRRLLGFSGIHDVAANTCWPDQFGDYQMYSSNQGAVSIETGLLLLTGSGADRWNKFRSAIEVTPGFTVDFDKTEDLGGFIFGCDAAWRCYLVWWDGTRVGVSLLEDFTETKLIDLPFVSTGSSHVRIAVKTISATVIDQPDDMAVSIWFDDRVACCYTFQYDTTQGNYVGFAAYGTTQTGYSSPVIPQFHHLVEMTYVGPNEEVSASLGRILGMDKIRVQSRFDGSVLIWRNTLTASSLTIEPRQIFSVSRPRNKFAPNHYRLIGGLYEADVVLWLDEYSSSHLLQGHIFTSGTDPNASIEYDVFERAQRKAIESLEQSDVLEMVCKFKPLLEAEDVIGVIYRYQTSPVLYRVTSIDFQAVWNAQNGVKYDSKLSLRRLRAIT